MRGSGLGLQLSVALRGDFDREVEAGRRAATGAMQKAVFAYGEDVQSMWRQDITGSGLAKSAQLAKTIRLRKYPNKGLDAAALVYSNFPLIQRAFESEKTLKAHTGKYLLVPNPEVWPTGRASRARSGSGLGGNYSQTWYAGLRRFGDLRIVPPRAGRPGLVVADARFSVKTGRFGKLTNTQRDALRGGGSVKGQTTIIVFFLVRQTRQPRLLRGSEIRRRARANAAGRIQQLFVRFFEQGAEVRALPSAG